MAKKPDTIAAINRARKVASKDRWQDLNRESCRIIGGAEPTDNERKAICAVWQTMPGYTCFNDALTITARL